MSKKADCRIEVEAAAALIHWKSLLAEEAAARARRLAADSGQPGHVTLAQYRQAAQGAVAASRAVGCCSGRVAFPRGSRGFRRRAEGRPPDQPREAAEQPVWHFQWPGSSVAYRASTPIAG
jgi:hypothetical protein